MLIRGENGKKTKQDGADSGGHIRVLHPTGRSEWQGLCRHLRPPVASRVPLSQVTSQVTGELPWVKNISDDIR